MVLVINSNVPFFLAKMSVIAASKLIVSPAQLGA
jgi:hypothetical protein